MNGRALASRAFERYGLRARMQLANDNRAAAVRAEEERQRAERERERQAERDREREEKAAEDLRKLLDEAEEAFRQLHAEVGVSEVTTTNAAVGWTGQSP